MEVFNSVSLWTQIIETGKPQDDQVVIWIGPFSKGSFSIHKNNTVNKGLHVTNPTLPTVQQFRET